MSLESKLPVELWTNIFSFACTDDGRTGRSLPVVSTFFHEVSLPLQLQSIAVAGCTELRRFADKLESTPSHLRRVHYLCVSLEPNHPLPSTMMDYDELVQAYLLQEFHPEYEEIVQRIESDPDWPDRLEVAWKRIEQMFVLSASRVFQVVGPHIQTLALQIGTLAPVDLFGNVHFPILIELTLAGSKASPLADVALAPALQILPSLQYLHFIGCGSYLQAFVGRIPELTHLRLSGDWLYGRRDLLNVICGIISSSPASAEHPFQARLLSHVHQVVIEPMAHDIYPRTAASRHIMSVNAMDELLRSDSSRKLVALRVPRDEGYGWTEAKEDWAARLNGGKGCWKASYVPSALHRLQSLVIR